jgi:pimeloyl-ACP methyl ester carboxylesterase
VTGTIRRVSSLLVALLAMVCLVAIDPLSANAARAPRASDTLTVGSLTLHRCHVMRGAYCGTLQRRWDPTGSRSATIGVGFAFVPARNQASPVLGTVVPHEGGPGYSSTDSLSYYAPMYGPLLRHRNLLVMDQRGTGLSEPVDCPTLQNLTGPYATAAGECGKLLGAPADEYGSALGADDLAAIIRKLGVGPVDLYGDSYGTFFAQVFAGRHPALLRSLLLDSAYPTYGETAWYPTQTPAMQNAFTKACERSSACASAGGTAMQLLEAVLHRVRQQPYQGMSRDGDGTRMHVVVDGKALVSVAFGATYGPEFYRELPAALRAALHGQKAPLLRLAAEAIGASSDAGDPYSYSEGLDAAVSCHDYPQLFDMTKSPKVRHAQLRQAVKTEEATQPDLYAPFTIREYLTSDWQELNWCADWPVAQPSLPAGPPMPRHGHYSDIPTLVLSGELDSITTAAEGAMVVDQFPNARQVMFANSFHVDAMGDFDHCAVKFVRAFVRDPSKSFPDSLTACASAIPPVRTMGTFPTSYRHVSAAVNTYGSHATLRERQLTTASAETVADVIDRWYNNYTSIGYGLHGGRWSYSGDRVLHYRFHRVRFTRDLAVSGTAVWSPYRQMMTVDLTVRATNPNGRTLAGSLQGSWDTRAIDATAHVHGVINGRSLAVSFVAP